MTLHLVKLCVGCDSIAALQAAIDKRLNGKTGKTARHVHLTRMMPKQADDLLDGGSLFWVMRGEILCREKILALESFAGSDGKSRCRIVMEPKLIPVSPRPMRAFQGWRYLKAEAAPPDLGHDGAQGLSDMPEDMRRELRQLGLL